MTLEIRPVTDEEIEQAEYITSYSFNNPERYDLGPAVERSRKFFPVDWSLASFEDGEMTTFIRMIPLPMRINGRGLSHAGVGPVVSLPSHRRKGHAGAVLKRGLEVMRERGQVLSGLHTPHPSLYRRFGWEIASERRTYSFAPKDVTLAAQPKERGRFRMLKPDDWQQADRVYRQYSAQRNGAIHRGEVWWREAIFSASQPMKGDVALWEDGSGEPQGYAVFYQATRIDHPDQDPFWVREITALTTDAYLNLISYILRHDLPRKIVWGAASDDPFMLAVADATKIKVEAEYDLMLRIADVEGALRMRPPANPGQRIELTIGVTDTSAPWNEGVWHVETAEDGVNVEKASGEADISLTATTLAPVFNGYLSPTAGALAGLIDAMDDDALARADAFFATLYSPYCADGF
jgi:predicted acetyltransferase